MGAEEHATAEVAVVAEGAARALTRVSLVDSSRAVIVLLGGYGPLLTLLLAGPGLVGRGAITVGGLVGAATYQASQILPALRLLTGTVGAYWTQLGVTVSRLAEATRPSTRPPAGAAPRRGLPRHRR